MLKGDLSSRPAPRLVVVFEGAVGKIPEDSVKVFSKAVSKGKLREAVSLFELEEMMMRKLMDLTWRENYNVSLVTWLGEEAAVEIEERMNRENIPIRGCFASSPWKLARSLAYSPDILAVYDPDPGHVLTYGAKGVLLADPLQIGRF